MKKKMSNRDKTFWAVVIPVVILFFAFNTLPMIKGVIYSFTNYKGYGTYDYVGFRNYADLFTDSRVGKSYLFTFKYALAGTILVNVLSLIMAVGLNSAIRFKSALRGIYFVPNILGGLVIGYIFSFIFTYTLFRETYHSVTSRFFSNNTCWKLIFAIHFISPTRLNKILFFYCIIMHYPV